MKKSLKTRLMHCAAAVFPLCFAANSFATEAEVGVLAVRGNLYAQQRWQPTLDWLNSHIPGTDFRLKPLGLEAMAKAVEEQSVDFILTNPGQAVSLGRQYALSWIATLSSTSDVSKNFGIGSALVVREDSPYHSLKQLAGKPVAAVSPQAFGGYLTLSFEAMQQGINPADFYSDVRFLGFPVDASLYQLRDHSVEAAVVPLCTLENMQSEGLLQTDAFRVINQKAPQGFACQASTALYPNWSFAKTERAPDQLAKQVSRALLAMPADSPAAQSAGASGWTAPVSLLSIDKLYQALDMHPLQQPWWKEALRWLHRNQEWAWALFILVIVLNGYHFWLEYRFNRSQKKLEQTQNRLKQKSELLERSQRLAIVGELGSSLAHEINQPLAAIRSYSDGGIMRLKKQRPNEDVIPVIEKIQVQVDRADAIVMRLRRLIKKRSLDKSQVELENLIHDTLELVAFRLSAQQVSLTTEVFGEPVRVSLDPVGIQQVLVNLINNAVDACERCRQSAGSQYHAEVLLAVRYQAAGVLLEVRDNGTGLETGQDNPLEAFVSTKNDGLGLGLAISNDVVEMHGGELELMSEPPHGCLARVTLPYQSGEKNV